MKTYRGLTVLFVLVVALSVPAAGLVSVTSPSGTAEYTTIEAALEACAGGETLNLLGDVTVQNVLPVTKQVTVDLGGHLLRNVNGQFIKPTAAADGLLFRNGRIQSADCCFAFQPGLYTVTATNVEFTGVCVLYGSGGTLDLQAGCVAATRLCFVSSWGSGGCGVLVNGAVVKGNFYDTPSHPGTLITVCSGSFTADPFDFLAPGSLVEAETHTVDGILCSYRVRRATADDSLVATTIAADGVTTTSYLTIAEALTGLGTGMTLRLEQDAVTPLSWPVASDVTVDLNGFELEKTTEGSLFVLGKDVGGLVIRNGRMRTVQTALGIESGAGDALLTNLVLHGGSVACGAGAQVTLADVRSDCDYLTSGGSTTRFVLRDVVFAPRVALHSEFDFRGTISAESGRFGVNMSDWLAVGTAQVCETAEVDGFACRYRVLPADEAGTLYAAEVVSADGLTTNAHATVAEALSACPADGTVRLLQTVSLSSRLDVPRSMTFDLNGLSLKGTSGNFIRPANNVTLEIKDGLVSSVLSIFDLAAGTAVTVNARACTLKGVCPCWGAGVLNLSDCEMQNTSLFASSNGSATMNVYGGHYRFGRWRDTSGDLSKGTVLRVHEGWFAVNPLQDAPEILTPGARVFYEDHAHLGLTFNYHVMPADKTEDWCVEAMVDDICYTNLQKAITTGTGCGGTVSLACDINRNVKMTTAVKPMTLDLNGHTISHDQDIIEVANNFRVTVRNGTVHERENYKSLFSIGPGVELTTESSLSWTGAAGMLTCGIYASGHNSRVTIDGGLVETTRLVSWGGGTNTVITVTGDGTNTCTSLYWPGSAPKTASGLVIKGGWWTVDPAPHMPADHLRLRHDALSPCPWRVRPLEKLAARGWDFDLADGLAVATGTCTAVPSDPIVVSVAGGLPERKTALADLSGVAFTSGTLSAASFACDPSWPPTARVTLEDGILSVQNVTGSVLVFR